MPCPLADRCMKPKCLGAAWAAKSTAPGDLEAFKREVVAVMHLTGWPVRRAAPFVMKTAMRRAEPCLLS